MQKGTLVQFVCFETTMERDEFFQCWELLMSEVLRKNQTADTLYQAVTKTKFNYISQHKCLQDDFHFVFKKDGRAERIRDSRIRVLQVGGYAVLKMDYNASDGEDVFKIMAFSTDPFTDISLFKQLDSYAYLNIYEAYYENSTYAYIFEYFAEENAAVVLQQQLKELSPGIETVVCKNCQLTVT